MSKPQLKKTKRDEETLALTQFSSLPEAVVHSCFARVSRWDHGALSIVSKTFKSLVVSPDLRNTRSLMGLTENYLYICLSTPPPGPVSTHWFICRFDKALEKGALTSKKRLCQVPSFPSDQPLECSIVLLEWGIYVIGGKINGKSTSRVLVLDCRSHKWHQVTSMNVARACAAASVVDGKIYVFGGCEASWGEVFDPKTQTWDSLPDLDIDYDSISGSVVMEKKVYVVATDAWSKSKSFYYSPSEGKWGKGNFDLDFSNIMYCVIDDLLYSCDMFGNLLWFEPKLMKWKKVKGMETLVRIVSRYDIELPTRSCKSQSGITSMSSFGGNIMVFWDVVPLVNHDESSEIWYSNSPERHNESFEIWCTEISLERHEGGGEVRGKIEWSDAVLVTDPLLYSCEVLCSVSVSF